MYLCIWFVLPNTVFRRFIHSLQEAVVLSFYLLSSIPLYEYATTLLIYSIADGLSGSLFLGFYE